MRSWTVEAFGAGRLGVAMAGLLLPAGLSLEEALQRLRSVEAPALQLIHWQAFTSTLHLLQASALAYKAFREGRMTSRSLSMELLLYVAGERQIKDALAKVGAREGRAVAICLADEEDEAVDKLKEALAVLEAAEDDGLLEDDPSKVGGLKEAFGVGDEELEASRVEGESLLKALTRCVMSRVAELDVKKEA